MQSNRRSNWAHESAVALKNQLEDLQVEQLLFQCRQETAVKIIEKLNVRLERRPSKRVSLVALSWFCIWRKPRNIWTGPNSSRDTEGADQKLHENVSASRRGLNLVEVQQQQKRATDDPGEPFNQQHSWWIQQMGDPLRGCSGKILDSRMSDIAGKFLKKYIVMIWHDLQKNSEFATMWCTGGSHTII